MSGIVSIRRVLSIWVGVEAVYLLSFVLLEHEKVEIASFLSYSLQTLLFILSVFIAWREPTNKNKFLFVNFAAFFAIAPFAHAFCFVGKTIPATFFFQDARFSRLLLDQYIFRGAYFLLLSFAIVYIALDLLFRDFGVLRKYSLTILVVGLFFANYFWPFFSDPLYLHHTVDDQDWRALDRSASIYKEVHKTNPSVEALASVTELPSIVGMYENSQMAQDANLRRIQELYPYLAGMNWQILVFKPLHVYQIFMSVLCLGFILLFFGYQFVKDPPQGAYIEKVMFLLLVFCTLEVLHGWSSINSLQWDSFAHVITGGQYVSIVVLGLIAVFFLLRLRFITSANGEFYEQELVASPTGITRWRDILDDLVVEKLFNRRLINGRLYVDPSRK